MINQQTVIMIFPQGDQQSS